MPKIEDILQLSPVIPVIVIDDLDDALPIARALFSAGLKVLEVTLRTEHGLTAIRHIKSEIPEAVIGAGSVITLNQMRAAINAGADFIVSPGHSQGLIRQAQNDGIAFLPGAATPSEMMYLLSEGFNHIKLFPAEQLGGVKFIKALAGPFPQLKFCPTGGIDSQKATEYLRQDNVLCVGGSWMLNKTYIKEKNWQGIIEEANQAASLERC